jgi:sialate O-acetylesterase
LEKPSSGIWRPISLPAKWQDRGLDFSGVLWFRKEIDIPSAWLGYELKLSLGSADKSDQSYFNGEYLGSMSMKERSDAWRVNREYAIPANLVKAGRNLVAVRVESGFFDGGLTGPAELMSLRCPALPDSPALPLFGDWLYAIESNYGHRNPNSFSELFNGMASPYLDLSLRGVAWYQGESNEYDPQLY